MWFETEHIILGLINLIFQFELFIAYSKWMYCIFAQGQNNLNIFLLFKLLLNLRLNFWSVKIIHQSFVFTAPPPTGMAKIVTFHFSEPWYKPRPVGTS